MQGSDNHRLDHVHTNLDLIYVVDLKLPENLSSEIEKFSITELSKNILLEDFSFVKPLFETCLEKFKNIDNNFKFKKLIRILLARLPKGLSHADGIHRDFDQSNHWSFLVHLKGNTGNTLFFDSIVKDKVCKSVDFKPFNLIIFPSLYAHRGLTSTTIDRYTINFIMEIDSKLNDQILKKSSPYVLGK